MIHVLAEDISKGPTTEKSSIKYPISIWFPPTIHITKNEIITNVNVLIRTNA